MGIMKCPIHGQVGFVATCGHVAKQIAEQKRPTGHHFTIVNSFFVCDDCFNSLGFERFMSLADLPLEELIEINDGRLEAAEAAEEAACDALEGLRSFCLKCVAEIERQSSSV